MYACSSFLRFFSSRGREGGKEKEKEGGRERERGREERREREGEGGREGGIRKEWERKGKGRQAEHSDTDTAKVITF